MRSRGEALEEWSVSVGVLTARQSSVERCVTTVAWMGVVVELREGLRRLV